MSDTDRSRSHPFAHIAHGLLMGAADSVPGVSGGTMALIVGIYERLLASIGSGFKAILRAARLDIKGSLAHMKAVDWGLLIPLGVGIGTALVVAAEFIPGMLEEYPAQMRAGFLGMVAASIAIPWRRIEEHSSRLVVTVLVAAVAAFAFTGLPQLGVGDTGVIRILASAAVAICAMILPGVSGAFLLTVLGMYEPTLDAIHERDLAYVATFAVGATLGLGSFALLLGKLLERYHDATMAALVGLMIGSLRALWPWQGSDRSVEWAPDMSAGLMVAGIALAGFVFVALIEQFGRRRARGPHG